MAILALEGKLTVRNFCCALPSAANQKRHALGDWSFAIAQRYNVPMVDRFTPEQRSRNMAAIRSKHTKPEMLVRRLVFSMGYRYRMHVASLPGKPDLVFPRYKKIVEVRGCFWHRHHCHDGRRVPATNSQYWTAKIERNVSRDRKNQRKLRALGWEVLVVWACEIEDAAKLRDRLGKFLR